MHSVHDEHPLSASMISTWLSSAGINANDWTKFRHWVSRLAGEKGFTINGLGQVEEYPLLLLTSTAVTQGPNLLVAAGFHGDEPASCWGVIKFLEDLPSPWLATVNLSILPLLNVTGFVAGTRKNRWGEDPNRGFCHTPSGRPEPSHEGILLMRNLPLLRDLARDGFLSLHEDTETHQFYLYTFENTAVPGAFSEMLRSAESEFFEACPDGMVEGASVSRGIVFRFCDGSFEDLMFHAGIPSTAATETPGLLPLARRVDANGHIIKAFVDYFQSN